MIETRSRLDHAGPAVLNFGSSSTSACSARTPPAGLEFIDSVGNVEVGSFNFCDHQDSEPDEASGREDELVRDVCFMRRTVMRFTLSLISLQSNESSQRV